MDKTLHQLGLVVHQPPFVRDSTRPSGAWLGFREPTAWLQSSPLCKQLKLFVGSNSENPIFNQTVKVQRARNSAPQLGAIGVLFGRFCLKTRR